MSKSDHKRFSRRGFCKTAVAMPVLLPGIDSLDQQPQETTEGRPSAPIQSGAESDFTRQSAALQPDKVIDSACQFCNSLCRLKVQMKSGRIINILGETADPVQAGGLCVKGPMMMQLVYNRHRLTQPLKRVEGAKGSPDSKFAPISWDEALTIIGRKFLDLRDAGEVRAIANKTSGRLPRGAGSLVNRFFTLLGSPNDTDVGPVCNDAGGNALAWTFGLGNFTNGYGKDEATGKEDLGSAKYFLFLGTNQAETHPVTFEYLLRQRARTKAKLVVIDPRLTPTGAQADEWISPRPHTDLALVLSMLSHIIQKKLFNESFVQKWVVGFDALKTEILQKEHTPEWAAQITGVPADKIKRIAEDYARAKPAAIFCNAGISHQLNAFDTYRSTPMSFFRFAADWRWRPFTPAAMTAPSAGRNRRSRALANPNPTGKFGSIWLTQWPGSIKRIRRNTGPRT
jgi:anaerobic selenocysteine-containing dehydrogenase